MHCSFADPRQCISHKLEILNLEIQLAIALLPMHSRIINKHSWIKQLCEENRSYLRRCGHSMWHDSVKHLEAALLVAAGATCWINSLSITAGINTTHTLLLHSCFCIQATLTRHASHASNLIIFTLLSYYDEKEKQKQKNIKIMLIITNDTY